MSSWEPKVQMPYYTPPGQTPRKVAIERLRRQFESLNIASLLLDAGVETDQLMPKDEISTKINIPPPVNSLSRFIYSHLAIQLMNILCKVFCIL